MALAPQHNPDPRLQTWADTLARRGLATPVAVGLELLKPVSFVLAQLLLVADPLARPLWGTLGRQWSWLLEDRARVDSLLHVLSPQRPSPGS